MEISALTTIQALRAEWDFELAARQAYARENFHDQSYYFLLSRGYERAGNKVLRFWERRV